MWPNSRSNQSQPATRKTTTNILTKAPEVLTRVGAGRFVSLASRAHEDAKTMQLFLARHRSTPYQTQCVRILSYLRLPTIVSNFGGCADWVGLCWEHTQSKVPPPKKKKHKSIKHICICQTPGTPHKVEFEFLVHRDMPFKPILRSVLSENAMAHKAIMLL